MFKPVGTFSSATEMASFCRLFLLRLALRGDELAVEDALPLALCVANTAFVRESSSDALSAPSVVIMALALSRL